MTYPLQIQGPKPTKRRFWPVFTEMFFLIVLSCIIVYLRALSFFSELFSHLSIRLFRKPAGKTLAPPSLPHK